MQLSRRFTHLEHLIIWYCGMNNAFLYIFPGFPHILSFPASQSIWLHRWKCLKQNWIHCVWFWMQNERRKDINLETTIRCLLPSSPTIFSLCHLYPAPRAMKSLPVGSECSSDLCGDGMSCCSFLGAADVRVKENMLRPEIYVFKLEDESAPSPQLCWQVSVKSCFPSFHVQLLPQPSNCVYKVYLALIWAKTLSQSYRISCWFLLHPKGSRPWQEPSIYSSTWSQTEASQV